MDLKSCMECGKGFVPADKHQVICDECEEEIAQAEEEEAEDEDGVLA